MKAISLQMEHQRNMCVALTLKYFFYLMQKQRLFFFVFMLLLLSFLFVFMHSPFFLYQSHRLFVCGGEYLLACPQQK